MSNIAKQNISTTTYLIHHDINEPGTFVSLGAATYPAGTILGRVTASNKWTPYDAGAGDGSEVPKAVLMGEITTTGVADVPTHVLIKGQVRTELALVWNAGSPIEMTDAERDTLRSFEIISRSSTELQFFDN